MSLRRRSAAASRRASGLVEALALDERALLLDPALRGFLAPELEARAAPADAPAVERLG
ncbi:MAG: hypothetical protein M3025_09145 [Actinomycetota bacterium]|nr:hypothetical protein [Actinomycetota bacterium]